MEVLIWEKRMTMMEIHIGAQDFHVEERYRPV
ncbi:hypothetical protein AMET1_0815 [Methanonatronarchaeum thermophilum]|uniref:Uncharacterized protein n=1 Tax=Methanonatronarchaeum thermophilum TaxID=1927129 RepID=A0A1Y3GCI1_9EURY|nr:hypothetical protein AMET1_0815 [Methanonatronarchaeum thermophilum]